MAFSSDHANDDADKTQFIRRSNGDPDGLLNLLAGKVEKWREKLLDLSNRNQLINCSFNPTRGVLEIDTPDCKTVWEQLVTDSESNTGSMRFPWKHSLVPQPEELDHFDKISPTQNAVQESDISNLGQQRHIPNLLDSGESKLLETGNTEEASNPNITQSGVDPNQTKQTRNEWNPPLEACRASHHLVSNDLLVNLSDRALDRRLRTFAGHARLAMSEQGVHSIYMAFGFLKWYESPDSDKAHRSPLMLAPVNLSRISSSAPWELTAAEDDVIDNLCLRQRLIQDFKLELPELPDLDKLEDNLERVKFLESVKEAVKECDRWEVEDLCVIGRFAFPKIAMWKDLGDHKEAVLSHDLCSLIGGNTEASGGASFGPVNEIPAPEKLDDSISPGEVKTILDCDSSQLEAIVAARKRVSFVLDGPPGTGKSQTIANIIADALSTGRTVLFVSEKVSALDVVKKRLDSEGLGDFCLECHSDKANRKAMLYELEQCLNLPPEEYDDVSSKLDELNEQRQQLNDYVRSIHKPLKPIGMSAFDIIGHISQLTREGYDQRTRCQLPDPCNVDRPRFDGWLRLIRRSEDLAEVIVNYKQHPWRGCKRASRTLELHEDLEHHINLIADKYDTIHQATKPLIDRDLIDSITPVSLSDLKERFHHAINAPDIPPLWLQVPREIISCIISSLEATQRSNRTRESLADYVEDVEEKFPEESILKLIAAPHPDLKKHKHRGLIQDLPLEVRARLQFCIAEQKRLASVAEATSRLLAVLKEWSATTGLYPNSRTDTVTYYELAKATIAAVTAGPARTNWFESPSQSVRKIAEKAKIYISKNQQLAESLAAYVSEEQISSVNEIISEESEFEAAVNQVQEICPHGTRSSLSNMQTMVSDILKSIDNMTAAANEILSTLGFERIQELSTQLSLNQIQDIKMAIEGVIAAGWLSGKWQDSTIRKQLLKAVEESLDDLKDAEEYKIHLDDRLSSRAFRESSKELTTRAAPYKSLWKRLFGGFSTYRNEVSELYSSAPPRGKILISDMLSLDKYHARIAEVKERSESLTAYLPPDYVFDEPDQWEKLKTSIQSFERLIQVWPELSSQTTSVNFMNIPGSLKTANDNLVSASEVYRMSLSKKEAPVRCESTALFSEIALQLENLDENLTVCLDVWQECDEVLLKTPDSLNIIRDLFKGAKIYLRRANDLNHAVDRYISWMPDNPNPLDQSTWNRLTGAIDAIETFAACKIDLAQLKTSWGDQGFKTRSASWESTALELIDTLNHFKNACMTASLHDAIVSPDDFSTVITEYLTWIDQHIIQLQGLDAVLSEGTHDFRVGNFEHALDLIRDLRELTAIQRDCDSQLASYNISPLEVNDLERATWLNQELSSGELAPLTQQSIMDAKVRSEVEYAYNKIKEVLNDEYVESWNFLTSIFDPDSNISSGFVINETSIEQLGIYLRELTTKIDCFDEWLKFLSWKSDMEDAGFGVVIDELIHNVYAPHDAMNVIALKFYRQLFDKLIESDRSIGSFELNEHERVRKRFQQLDRWEVQAASSRIREYQLTLIDRPRNNLIGASSSELGILRRQIEIKRKHKPLRRLFAEIPSVLQKLKPCIMMSPLSVSTFLDSDALRFDLVIFDEASQVFPWDAIGAIYRGNQLIVAGDEKQLPPTNFFNRTDVETDEEDDIGDFESILTLCKSIGMPSKRLRWHYRSRREALIAFSNRHFYDGDLVTFPSVEDATGDAVKFELVSNGCWSDRKNINEAIRVVDLIIDHVKRRPDKSLGVIAFNSAQQRVIEDVLYDRRRREPEVDALFDTTSSEPMFIKNLENVQGDERDVIFLSMGYGLNEAGKFIKNFGPLSKPGGERRLNVAITRARQEITFIASVRAADMDLSGSKSEGAHLLKHYLEYAEKGVDTLASQLDEMAGNFDSPFEEEVAHALIKRGFEPVPQVGCGGFRIDLAIKHPERKGQFCLGIECDGATYHSSYTARDRDRIRQSILEQLGWRIIRIWSSDWIRNPDRQIDRVIESYQSAIAESPDSELNTIDETLEETGLTPRIVLQSNDTRISTKEYNNISEVPNNAIKSIAISVLQQAGSMSFDDLIKLTSRELGFKRLGEKIRSRIDSQIKNQLETGSIKKVGERITLNK